jgi:sugar lactone lactonase YvrE
VRVVAGGLDNPRGLAFDSRGTLYVAEAGHGGRQCFEGGEMGTSCAGLTSGISAIKHGRAHRVVDHLISTAGPDGTAAEGVVAVATRGHRLYAQIGLNSRALPPQGLSGAVLNAARRELGRTIWFTKNGFWRTIASTGNKDYDWTADHKELQPDQFPDANPNGLAVRGRTVYVADAGANLLAKVSRRGRVSTLAYFQVPAGSPTDGVPTCVASARDGSLYVGELLGGDFAPGHARVWQVWPNGRARVKWTGFTGIQGCGFDNRGNFYVTEFQANGMFGPDPSGAVVRIKPDGTRTTFGTGSLFFPSGFAYRDGGVYVSNWSIMPSKNPPSGHTGEVVRIDVRNH